MAEKTTPANTEQVITITSPAIDEIKRLMAEEKQENLFLRLGVSAGGCSGMSYSMAFDTDKEEFDRVFDFDEIKVLIDLKALMYLAGSILDYQGGLMGGGFTFHNPNAKRSCGCGSSFTC